MPGPLQQALLGLGITSPSLLARGADLDQASQRLLIEAADELPPTHQRPSAATLNATAGTAALLNHALASGNPKAARLLPARPGRTARTRTRTRTLMPTCHDGSGWIGSARRRAELLTGAAKVAGL